MQIITRTHALPEIDACVRAVIDVTPELHTYLARLRDTWQRLKAVEPDFLTLVLRDNSALWSATDDLGLSDIDLESIDHQSFVALTTDITVRQPDAVDDCQLHVCETGVFWESRPKHADASVQTELLPYDVLLGAPS